MSVAPSPSLQLFNKIVACISRTFFCMVASLNHDIDAIGLISKSNNRNVNSTSVQLWGRFRFCHRPTSLVILDYKNCNGKGIVALISKIIVSSIAFVATSISSEIPMESILSHFLNHNLSWQISRPTLPKMYPKRSGMIFSQWYRTGPFIWRWGTPDRWGDVRQVTPPICKRDELKKRDCMDRWVNPPKQVTSPTWGPPPPCKQALKVLNDPKSQYMTEVSPLVAVYHQCIMVSKVLLASE